MKIFISTSWVFILLMNSSYGQPSFEEAIIKVITMDSVNYLTNIKTTGEELIILKEFMIEIEEDKVVIDEWDINLQFRDLQEYNCLKKRPIIPILFLNEIIFSNDGKVSYNIIGALPLHKKGDAIDVFSDILVHYRFDCEKQAWSVEEFERLQF